MRVPVILQLGKKASYSGQNEQAAHIAELEDKLQKYIMWMSCGRATLGDVAQGVL